MIALLQRVTGARVEVNAAVTARIGVGIVALIGVERGDCEQQADRLLQRLLGYRIFPDTEGRMNRSLRDVHGGLLLVPQFTLAADTRKGNRPGFTPAALPEQGERLFAYLLQRALAAHEPVAAGTFGADMQVTLTNDGPVTFWLQAPPPAKPVPEGAA